MAMPRHRRAGGFAVVVEAADDDAVAFLERSEVDDGVGGRHRQTDPSGDEHKDKQERDDRAAS